MSALKAMKDAERHLRRALKLATVMEGRWGPEHVELLGEDVRARRDVVESAGHLLDGDSARAEALLTMEAAQRQIERERLQDAIRETARRHGWRAP